MSFPRANEAVSWILAPSVAATCNSNKKWVRATGQILFIPILPWSVFVLFIGTVVFIPIGLIICVKIWLEDWWAGV